MPDVCDRSCTEGVGRPPLQKNASIFPSFNASTDSDTPSPWRVRSLSGSSPAARSTRNAITSVPLPGEPVDTTLPLSPATDVTPDEASATSCV